MAYLFNRLNEALDGAQGGGKRASDLLQGGAPVQQDKETLGGAPSGMATQASAVIGAGGGAAPKPAAAGEDTTAVNSEARNKTFAKNQGTQLQAGAADSLTGGIKQSQAALQGAADAYLKEGYGGFDKASVDKALNANDETARTTVSDFLNTSTKDPEKFQFDASSLDGLRDQTRALQTDGGLQAALQVQNAGKAGSEGYTAGEARLDASFLKNSDAFKAQKAKVIDSFANFAGASDKAGVQAKTRSEGYVEALGKEKKGLRELLTGKVGGIRSAVDTAVVDRNAALAKERELSRGSAEVGVRDDAKLKLAELEKSATALTPITPMSGQSAEAMAPKYDVKQFAAYKAALEDMIRNPSKYVSQANNLYAADDVTTEDQRDDYAWLNTILGRGEPALSVTGGRTFSADATKTGSVGSNLSAIDTFRTTLEKTQAEEKRKSEWVDPDENKQGLAGKISDGANALFKGLDPTVAANNLFGNLGLSGRTRGIDPGVAAAQHAREAAEADKIYDKGIVVGSKKAARAAAAKSTPQKAVDDWNAKRNKENPAFAKAQGSFSVFGGGSQMSAADQKAYDAWLKKNPPPKGA